jgi:hypothetical protein
MNGVWSLTSMTLNSNVLTPYFNGTAQDIRSGTMGSTTGFIIGEAMSGYRGQCLNGYIAEILMYNTSLTNAERQQVEGYLAWKWGINTSLSNIHPFYRFRSATAVPFLPTNISGIKLWLDGNDPAGTGLQPSTGALATWIDKSGSSNHMTAVGTSPTFSNSPPGSVYFGGAGYFSNSNAVLSNTYTAFFIFKQTYYLDGAPLYSTSSNASNVPEGAGFGPYIDPNYYYLLLGDDGSNSYSVDSPFIPNTMNLAVLSFSGNEAGCNVSLYYNGSNILSTTQQATITYSNLNIGGLPAAPAYFTGYIYEVIAYNGTLTTNERQSVEGYLAQKWKL